MTLRSELQTALRGALDAAGLPSSDAQVVSAADRRFGDYQSNIAMALAREAKANPRAIAGRILEHLDVGNLCFPPEIAGAGFLNFRIRPEALAPRLKRLVSDSRLGTPPARPPLRIILDFSSPNLAKPMHVGHIRTTILGDSLARIARFLGHDVIADNHLGDWGTQFGKVIYGWKHHLDRAAFDADPVAELLRLYRLVNALESEDQSVGRAVRAELVKLQQGDEENLGIWKTAVEVSWRDLEKLYALLDIRFDERLGESFYRDRLDPLVNRLLEEGIAEMSEGAVCVFFRDHPSPADKPCLIRKSDGGFLYATTDLATMEYRRERWNPDAVWYVAGAPQALHFQEVFAAARRMGLEMDARHIAFGSILGEDRKIMKTRSGESVQLGELIGEAVARAEAIIRKKNPALGAREAAETAKVIGIGAVKYAELSQHRMTDYVFSWDKMLAFQGNTAPYLQNAYVRIRSIFRRLDSKWEPGEATVVAAEEPERALGLRLLQFGETVPEVLDDFRPNLLANYLYDLAITFHAFYEACPVLQAQEPVRSSRLLLCELTARVLSCGLGLLGIGCPERM